MFYVVNDTGVEVNVGGKIKQEFQKTVVIY
jgi:hypothetical protein